MHHIRLLTVSNHAVGMYSGTHSNRNRGRHTSNKSNINQEAKIYIYVKQILTLQFYETQDNKIITLKKIYLKKDKKKHYIQHSY